MSMFCFYFLMLLLGFILIYRGMGLTVSSAPVKIRMVTSAAFIFLGLRYIILMVFLFSGSIKYLYLFKPVVFLNFLAIPVLAVVNIFILARKDKLKFNYCIFVSIVILILYIIGLINLPVNVELYKNLGYRLVFTGSSIMEYAYLIINTLFFFVSLLLGDNNIKKTGIGLVTLSALAAMLETVLKLIGITILPALLLGDLFWLMTADYALSRLKK